MYFNEINQSVRGLNEILQYKKFYNTYKYIVNNIKYRWLNEILQGSCKLGGPLILIGLCWILDNANSTDIVFSWSVEDNT